MKNLSTSAVYTGAGLNLQTAIDAANPGAVLQIQGACVGTFTIGKNLALTGKSSARFKMARLDGNDQGSVVTITAGTVSIKNLKITGGNVTNLTGGGITNFGVLTLSGATTITGNHSGLDGAGGIVNFGTATMNGSTSVTANPGGGVTNYNTAAVFVMNGSSSVTNNPGVEGTYGAGIWNGAGTVTMNGHSLVAGNSLNSVSVVAGGGMYDFSGGHVTLNDFAAITGNSSNGYAGGIFVQSSATFTMNDSSSVSNNTAGVDGGGIYISGGVVTGAVAGVNVTGNTPDDIAP